MTITPGQADRWAQDATDGPWKLNPHGCILVDDGTDDPPGPHGFIGTMCKNFHPDEESNGLLMAAAPELAQTIAGMEWEYAVEMTDNDWEMVGIYGPDEPWGSEADARGVMKEWRSSRPIRLIRRLIGPVEVAE